MNLSDLHTPLFGQYSQPRSLVIHDDTDILQSSSSNGSNVPKVTESLSRRHQSGEHVKTPVGSRIAAQLNSSLHISHDDSMNVDQTLSSGSGKQTVAQNGSSDSGRRRDSRRRNGKQSTVNSTATPTIRIQQRSKPVNATASAHSSPTADGGNCDDDEIVFKSKAGAAPASEVAAVNVPIVSAVNGRDDLLASAIKAYERTEQKHKHKQQNHSGNKHNKQANKQTAQSAPTPVVLKSDRKREERKSAEPTPVKQYVIKQHNQPAAPLAAPSEPLLIAPYTIDDALPIILLDAANIAMSYGKHEAFRCEGIQAVFKYYADRHHRVRMFLPAYNLDVDYIRRKQTGKLGGDANVKATHIPDNVELLHAWQRADILVTTPAQDYDDDYIIQYAKLHQPAYIVTNDQYRDSVEHMREVWQNNDNGNTAGLDEQVRKHKTWLDSHLISYTFVDKTEFLPNPKMSHVHNAGQ